MGPPIKGGAPPPCTGPKSSEGGRLGLRLRLRKDTRVGPKSRPQQPRHQYSTLTPAAENDQTRAGPRTAQLRRCFFSTEEPARPALGPGRLNRWGGDPPLRAGHFRRKPSPSGEFSVRDRSNHNYLTCALVQWGWLVFVVFVGVWVARVSQSERVLAF